MDNEFKIDEKTTVKQLLEFLSFHFPDYDVTINNQEFKVASDNMKVVDLFVLKRQLPVVIKKGRDFDDTFMTILMATGLSMYYLYNKKELVCEYKLLPETTMLEIYQVFRKHFPLYEPQFITENGCIKKEETLKEIGVEPFSFQIYNQFSSTKNHFVSNSGIEVRF